MKCIDFLVSKFKRSIDLNKYLIVGIGNIGTDYFKTRHNLGFEALDFISDHFDSKFEKKRLGEVSKFTFKGKNIILLKPNTYVNLSGKSVRYWLNKEKINIENLMVVIDDINLPFGTIRIRTKGSDGGHNGLKNINELLSSPKELSENHMIVDLVRNDLSRIAKKGSVKVKSLNTLKTFKRVHQLISTIEAKVSSKLKLSEILNGTFPMGSMTGAPKIESMNIIDEFESTKRGLYSGSVGYINPDMNFDFNVVIRSIVYSSSNKMLTVNVGSAITHKSIAEKEYEECLVKAEPMIQSLK